MINMKKRYIILLIVILIIGVSSFIYFNDYYHADSTALKYINGSENVTVNKTANGLLLDGPGNDSALIFYPGAKVEYTSYLALMNEIAENGVDVYIVEMPLNIAFFGSNSADDIIKDSNYSHYFLSGHSLGGVVASGYAAKHNVDGLVLLAAYPTEEINKPVLSIYGSEDKVLNLEKYNEAKPLMKGNFTEFIVNGGNHAQFANYGNQSGDGIASVNSTVQQNVTANQIMDFIRALV